MHDVSGQPAERRLLKGSLDLEADPDRLQDVLGLVPLRPIEVNLIGLTSSSLDDEDGEAWWKDWPARKS